MDWKFYIIYNNNYSYAGVTPDTERRIKKHNQELPGGSKYTKILSDGWTVETRDGRNSAQWEHTLAVTSSGVEILTKRSEEHF